MIEASTVSVKTMADDTLRLTIDIEPRYAQEAFALFGARGMPCVIARLTQEAAAASQKAKQAPGDADVPPTEEKPKGGPLARLAGQWCNDPLFRHWLGEDTPEAAADHIREACRIRSRAELDHDERAAAEFHRMFRLPFADYCREAGVQL